jgi:hypothetical protein
MRMPTLSRPANRSGRPEARWAAWNEAGVSPQAQICTPCLQIGGGRWCVNLPIFGRKCFSVPNVGRWKACCRARFGWPPVSCGISRC